MLKWGTTKDENHPHPDPPPRRGDGEIMEAEFTEGMTAPSPARGREILNLLEYRAGEDFH